MVDGIQILNHDKLKWWIAFRYQIMIVEILLYRPMNRKELTHGIMTFQVNLSLISSYISNRYQTCFFQRDIKNAGPFQRGKIYMKALWQFICHNRVVKTDCLVGFQSFGLVITERHYIPGKIPYIPGITFNPAQISTDITQWFSTDIFMVSQRCFVGMESIFGQSPKRPTLKFTILL